MKAMLLHKPRPIEEKPLEWSDVPLPEPGPGEVRLAVRACAVCCHDVEIVEGTDPPPRLPLIPGHQVVGTVEARGAGAEQVWIGQRVGVARLYRTCGRCEFCLNGQGHFCPQAERTGQHADGGYATAMIVPVDALHPLPDGLSDEEAAPLLCAGAIGYRALQLATARANRRLGIYGMGLDAQVTIQLAHHWGCQVYVLDAGEQNRQRIQQWGAVWAGEAGNDLPAQTHSSIVFAPTAKRITAALRSLERGGTLVLAGTPALAVEPDYPLLFSREQTVRFVTTASQQDIDELLSLAETIHIHLEPRIYPLEAANEALLALKQGTVQGSTVLTVAQFLEASSAVPVAQRSAQRPLRTSEVAGMFGLHPNTIRAYEEWGFLGPVPRARNGYRMFGPEQIEQIHLIRTSFHYPYVGGRQLMVDLVRQAATGDLGGGLELAYTYLARVRTERARAEAATQFLERWAQGSAADATIEPLRISQTAKLMGVTADVLRNWERNGLIHVPRDPHSGYRLYGAEEIGRLRVIRMLRHAGYSMMAILRMLLYLEGGHTQDLRRALDTPRSDEDVLSAADRWLSTLTECERHILEVIAQLEKMIRREQA